MKFPSTNLCELDKEFPVIRQPNIIGDFSVDGGRRFVPDRRGLQLLLEPTGSAYLNLDKGFNSRVPRSNTGTEGLDNLLHWILHNREKFDIKARSLNTDFLCYRGLLRLLLNTPYEQKEPWIIRVVKWRGTFYLLQEDTELEKARKRSITERDLRFQYWGYKFEQYMTSHSKDCDQPVDENEEFCCVFRSRIGDMSVMFGAEMDGYRAKDRHLISKLIPSQFVEFKTSRKVETEWHLRTLKKFKFIKWWAQSFLVGIEEIQVGWRDEQGVVSSVESIKVSTIPKMAVEWSANVCANFLLDFLRFLKESMVSDCPDKVFRISWDPRSGFSSEEEQAGSSFLPSWYTEQLFKL